MGSHNGEQALRRASPTSPHVPTMTTASSLPLQVLHAYFDVVRPLGDYLREVTAFSGGHHDSLGLVHETDTRAYRQLLTTCVVATRGRPVAAASLNVTPAMGHLREVYAESVLAKARRSLNDRLWSEPRRSS